MATDRRKFLLNITALATVLGLPHKSISSMLPDKQLAKIAALNDTTFISVFSKNLQWLSIADMAKAVAKMGFDGIDITVRPNGHVLPENVKEDLPKAVEAIRKNGLEVYMITTAIASADEEFTEAILKTAGSLGIPYYRMGWLDYNKNISSEDNLEAFKNTLSRLAKMGEQYNIKGAYQNHSGENFGSPVIDLYLALRSVNSKWMGCQYDIRHATVEGANSWPIGFNFIKEHINTINLKDFDRAKTGNKSKEENVPLGTGAVDFEKYFSYLKQITFKGPVCMHFEYPLGGAEDGAKKITIPAEEVFTAMRRDLELARKWLA